jgi:hypothetical protein
MPFMLLRDLVAVGVPWAVIPISGIVAFLYVTIERTSAICENPFENLGTDVPLTYFCTELERDVKVRPSTIREVVLYFFKSVSNASAFFTEMIFSPFPTCHVGNAGGSFVSSSSTSYGASTWRVPHVITRSMLLFTDWNRTELDGTSSVRPATNSCALVTPECHGNFRTPIYALLLPSQVCFELLTRRRLNLAPGGPCQ